MTIELSAGSLYVSQGTPTNGKLLNDGPHVATPENDGNTVTLSLAAGETYTVEAAGTSGDGKFTVSVKP